MEVLWILLLSIPFFYILGVVQLISWFRPKPQGKLPTERLDRVRELITELGTLAHTHPTRTLKEQVSLFEAELSEAPDVTVSLPQEEHEKSIVLEEKRPTPSVWDRWYETNSINLLLYVGAFFIVASAAIFVGFQWETISGIMKASSLTLCCLAFFGFGVWFYSLPKIRNAGATFLAIASLLIPIVGAGWYTFVFQSSSHNPGPVWLVTSLVAIVLYASLALVLRTSFYSYLTTLSGLSIILSFIMLYQLETSFYILGGMITSFILLVASLLLKRSGEVVQDTFLEPVITSSQLLMPASILFGVVRGLQTDALISLEGTLSLFLASLYYGVLYIEKPDGTKAAATEILFSLCIAVFGGWQDYRLLDVTLFLAAIGFFYLLLPTYYRHHQEASDTSLIVGFTQLLILFLTHVFNDTSGVPLLLFSLFPVAGAFLIAYVKKAPLFVSIGFALLALSLYIAFDQGLLPGIREGEVLGILYSLLGAVGFITMTRFRDDKRLLTFLAPGTALYLLLGFIATQAHKPVFLGITLLTTVLFFVGSIRFRQPYFTYAACALLCLAVFTLHSVLRTDEAILPLFFTSLAFVLYGASLAKLPSMSHPLRYAALSIMVVTPMLFGVGADDTPKHPAELLALVSAYATLLLYGIDVFLFRSKKLAYVLSALAMGTFLWQLNYASVSEALAYSLPLGAYFLILGYLNHSAKSDSFVQLLDYLGLAFLLVPSLIGVYGDESLKHTVVLFLLGLGLFFAGISLSRTLFKRVGIGALIYATLARTYQYLFQLPRWLIVGILGIMLIGSAIFLLLRRSEAKR